MNQSIEVLRSLKACLASGQAKLTVAVATLLAIATLLLSPMAAWAHHPFGGSTPDTLFKGFLSGLGHPVIGLDHLAFVIAAGLLAAVMGRGLIIPVAFVIASLAGTGIHVMSLDLPAPELMIAASVLLFGGLLALKNQPNSFIVTVLGAIAGLFHGYAYGEAIVGADMAPLVSYLLGFASIQMAIALVAYGVAKRLGTSSEAGALNLRFAGFALSGAGFAFLSGVFL
ncbi:MAG: HupE/UreJ family protein [Elainellaceae cyanobacterium]